MTNLIATRYERIRAMGKYRVVLIVQDYVEANSQDEAVEIANLEMENGEIIVDRLDEEEADDEQI
jgi:DNA-directed RNA polymerase subunit K/omega